RVQPTSGKDGLGPWIVEGLSHFPWERPHRTRALLEPKPTRALRVVPGEAAARPHLGLKGEAAAATLDGRRRRPRRSSSVSVLRPFRPSAKPTALPCRRCGRSGPQRSRPPSTTPIELRAAEERSWPTTPPANILPGSCSSPTAPTARRPTPESPRSLPAAALSPPSKIPDGDCSRRRSPPAAAWRLTVDTRRRCVGA
ncbi:unnamed protein product, partial [Urochloa humidicola]